VFRPFPDLLLWRKFYVKNASIEVARVTFVLFLSLMGLPHIYTTFFGVLFFCGPFLGEGRGDVA